MLVLGCGSDEQGAEELRTIVAPLARGEGERYEEVRTTAKGTFTFVKYFDEQDRSARTALDANGRPVPWADAVDVGIAPVVDDTLRVLIDAPIGPRPDVLPVLIALRSDEVWAAEGESFTDSVDFDTGVHQVDGRVVSRSEFEMHANAKEGAAATSRVARQAERRSTISQLSEREGWNLSADDLDALSNTNGPLVRELVTSDLDAFAERNRDLIAGLGINEASTGDDSLATAMAATNADWAIAQGLTGAGIGVYMTEGTGCASSGYITKYTVLGQVPDSDHHRRTSFVLRSVSPDSHIYCRGPDSVLPLSSDLTNPGPGGNPMVRIISHSRTKNKHTSTYDTLMQTWDDFVYSNNLLIVNSSGNSDDCDDDYVGSPGRALNLLTVGAYDDSDDSVWNGGCYKDPSDIGNTKPELVAPGVGISPIGTDASGNPYTTGMTGTSHSTPHVAALLANFGEDYPTILGRAAQAKAMAMKGALDPISGSFGRVGYGGLDFKSLYPAGFTQYWHGPHSSWSTWAANDGWPTNGDVDVTFQVSSASITKVRVVVSWLTRGSWTYPHRNDTFPLGLDFDLTVYAPNGGSVGQDAAFKQGFAVVEFDPTASGTYRARISRVDYPDSNNAIRLAIAVGKVP